MYRAPPGLGPLLRHRRLVDQEPRRLDARLHVRDLESGALELADLLTEGLALAGIRHAGLVGRLGDAQCLRRNADAPGIQNGHGDLEALAFFAQACRGRHAAVLEEQLAGGRGSNAQLRLLLAAAEARRISRVDQEGADALLLQLRVWSS